MPRIKQPSRRAHRFGVAAVALFLVGLWLQRESHEEVATLAFAGALACALLLVQALPAVDAALGAAGFLLAAVALGVAGDSEFVPWVGVTALAVGVLAAHRLGRFGPQRTFLR